MLSSHAVPVDQLSAPATESQDAMPSSPSITSTDTAQAPSVDDRIYFTGSGKEYFRIWIVNLCLSLLTLGVYSAWAKVRRLKYFDQNTVYAGAVFNFHGRPEVILRGRIISVIFLFFYHYVYGLSKMSAIVIAVALLFMLPLMLRGALRFRLQNTSYRGIRFQFHGSRMRAYLVYLPVVVVFLLPGLVTVLYPRRTTWLLYAFLPYLSWPWLYAGMKRYQNGNFAYGRLRSATTLGRGNFVWPFVAAGLVILLATFLGGLLAAIFAFVIGKVWGGILGFVGSIIFAYVIYLILGPALQTNLWNLIWNATSLPGIQIRSALSMQKYVKLQTKNFFLTMLSLGLYRPFAVVAAYRFRLEHMQLTVASFDAAGAAADAQGSAATSDASADMFGFDLSW
ncbi:YjgN family protein [Undibacterium curvum]|uniref:DUF898 domain-containing protein n=1 Tax=Undibacterium curvum TaxID=2762294 RepID=A0ABR7A7Y8_9BURK|nr:YjgN family protein [Undibacterium curvum]MBC3933023.1 DUF898 domain-containing protein [Undibacterium curvum]